MGGDQFVMYYRVGCKRWKLQALDLSGFAPEGRQTSFWIPGNREECTREVKGYAKVSVV